MAGDGKYYSKKIFMDKIKEHAILAQKILGGNTTYAHDKKMISDIFKIQNKDTFEKIKLRLTVIDSYYSTQMNKRLFGIEEIAHGIELLSDSDKETLNKFKNFLDNSESDKQIIKLFNDDYGYNKNGEKFGVAHSLISKYAYFLSDFNFPIYDSLAIDSYKVLVDKNTKFEIKKLIKHDIFDYFKNIKYLNEISNINNYDILDNFLWLCGKLNKGSFSLVLTKEKYLELVDQINFKNSKSKDIDIEIKKYIEININNKKISKIFIPEMIDFINFCYK